MLEITFWSVMSGDAITIRYQSTDGNFKNIFIDAGYVGTYKRTVKQALLAVQHRSEKVDLWVITHTDNDHVGGVAAFLKDKSLSNKDALVNQYWFNWSDYKLILPDGKIGTSQGIRLRDYLRKTGRLDNAEITNIVPPVDLDGMCITFLSPDTESLQRSKCLWNMNEQALISQKISDHSKKVDILKDAMFVTDNSPWNGGSIAFLAATHGKTILLLGDSHPSIIVDALRHLGYSEDKRLFIDLMKLSHHGSKGNTSPELLGLIACNNYAVCANGISHGLPDKTTLAWILTHPSRKMAEQISFYFNNDTPELRQLFEADTNAEERYNFRCVFPKESDMYLKIEL